MRTFVVPLRVLHRGSSEALLGHVTRLDGVLAATLDRELVLRVTARDGVSRDEVLDVLAEWALSPRSV